MEHTEILKFITETGFRTKGSIQEKFSKEDPEILNSNLEFLISRRNVRKISLQAPQGSEELFYIVPH
jgi:hypothetical protein